MAIVSCDAGRAAEKLRLPRDLARANGASCFRFIPVVAFLCVICSAPAARTLSCQDPRVAGREAAEIRRLAPGVVQRKAPHLLVVKTGAGAIEFADKPPYDEELSGLKYRFCTRAHGFVHLLVYDEGLLTGVLINDIDGKITEAGKTVTFSPDGRAYFATEQPDGLDGEVWKIHAIDGTLSWSGYSFIPRMESGKVVAAYAELDHPIWTGKGQFSAHAVCIGPVQTRWPVKLMNISGRWQWRPVKPCPK